MPKPKRKKKSAPKPDWRGRIITDAMRRKLSAAGKKGSANLWRKRRAAEGTKHP